MSRGPEGSKDVGLGQGITKDQWKEIKDWWLNQIIPNFRNWDATQIRGGARFLTDNQTGATELIHSKLNGNTRLVVIGMLQQPRSDNLPFEILEELPRPGFIVVEARDPKDDTGGLKEDKEGLTTVDLGGGMRMDLPHKEAQRLYPDKYKNPDARNTAYDELVVAAKDAGVDVLYSMRGATWKEMNGLAATDIATYMRRNPDARGVYFGSIYSVLKWPGYESEEEQKKLGYGRPLTSASVFSTDPRTDASIRMPAYALEQEFPGQVYSFAQFIMPKGYGAEWKNLRSAVVDSQIRNRFAIDSIATSPFAVQRYIFQGLAELSDTPEEELWKYFGTIAQGFFGPVEVRWDKVLDGVIIYPSDEKMQPSLTTEQMMEAAAKHIGQIIDNENQSVDHQGRASAFQGRIRQLRQALLRFF